MGLFRGVKGSANASHYTTLLGHTLPPTPLWSPFPFTQFTTPEQSIAITIDNSSVFVPGGGPPQYGFRRTELISQVDGNHTATYLEDDVGTSVFHFSIREDEARRLNYSHEYQIVWIEPSDGSHVFGIQLALEPIHQEEELTSVVGSPFTDPTGPLPDANAHSLKVLDHALNVLFSAPFTPSTWHNFAVQVDWNSRTLAALYSKDGAELKAVTKVVPNLSTPVGAAGQGDFHFGVLKLPLVNPADSAANQGDVVHYGIQEGTTEGLIYSGVFVERTTGGILVGNGRKIKAL
ncbi:hypothetical protein HWV62_29861 [Athelia sp. TMB]|nr:hypothetical protein HWV62_29861 [Athelia sp. TMB]